jgi:hypothetical protein
MFSRAKTPRPASLIKEFFISNIFTNTFKIKI